MPTGDYLPTTETELLVWFNNFQRKFAQHGPALGFTAEDVTTITNDYHVLAFVVGAVDASRKESLARTSYRNVVRDGPPGTVPPVWPVSPPLTPPPNIVPGVIPRLRAMVARIKVQPGYTSSIGADLGVIASSSAAATTSGKPTASATAQPNSTVQVDWTKGRFDGVLVEGQRGDEAAWTLLGTDTVSPYVDNRDPLVANAPEVRRYRLRYIKKDVPTGDYSDVMTVTTTP